MAIASAMVGTASSAVNYVLHHQYQVYRDRIDYLDGRARDLAGKRGELERLQTRLQGILSGPAADQYLENISTLLNQIRIEERRIQKSKEILEKAKDEEERAGGLLNQAAGTIKNILTQADSSMVDTSRVNTSKVQVPNF